MPRWQPQERHSLLPPMVLGQQIAMPVQEQRGGRQRIGPTCEAQDLLMAYRRSIFSSRAIERTCQRKVQCMAISGDSQPSHAHKA